MKAPCLAGFLLLLCVRHAGAAESFSIAIGSCLHQDRAQPIWEAVLAQNPDVFIFMGDNIYADTVDMAVMKEKYARLGAQSGFQRLRAACPILATWDDHDYGLNDAGAEYPEKE